MRLDLRAYVLYYYWIPRGARRVFIKADYYRTHLVCRRCSFTSALPVSPHPRRIVTETANTHDPVYNPSGVTYARSPHFSRSLYAHAIRNPFLARSSDGETKTEKKKKNESKYSLDEFRTPHTHTHTRVCSNDVRRNIHNRYRVCFNDLASSLSLSLSSSLVVCVHTYIHTFFMMMNNNPFLNPLL